ncbi:sodium stibogluconate resistance protein [Trypanosoma grayi]|uniref:sodium stibogluconate resistance protein n=1 Tax=Trypanosoma grayi TaxID=71804 RepID=UPI0004F40275|nr:sodium stibogluconate resistance protein [Trypanosoma grayi]KEG08030.1 sodium stibogluconate resistance protein [Trypanosoma grayi]
MGSGASAEVHMHSRLYQEGYKSLQEGRYTYAEIYYDQAIEKHEGHVFWSRLDVGVEWERKSGKADRKKADGKGQPEAQAAPPVIKEVKKPENAPEKPTEDAEGGDEGDEQNEAGGEGEDEKTGYLEIPVDSRLIQVLDYLLLRADIADSYMAAGRLDEASPHVDYIATHTQTFMRCLQSARDFAMGDDGEDGDNPLRGNGQQHRRQRLGMLMGGDMERESILDCLDQHLRLHWVSSLANSVYIAFEKFKGGQGEKKRKKELDAAVVTCMKAEEALYHYAQRRAKSLTNAVVLNFLEVILEEMEASSSTTSAPDERSVSSRSKLRVNNLFDDGGDKGESKSGIGAVASDADPYPITPRLQVLHDRRILCRSVPAPQQAPALRRVPWVDEEIRRVVPGTNYYLEIQCGMVDEKRKKQLQKRSLKFVTQKRVDYNDRVQLGKSFDEENALLLFPVLLIQADVQLELGAATKGIQALDLVENLATQLYGVDSLEWQSLMRRVLESRKRGVSMFMMFED